MAKISTAKRCQETHPETNMEGSGLYNETSQHCWIPQGTAGPDGKKKNPKSTAEAEKHEENLSGG